MKRPLTVTSTNPANTPEAKMARTSLIRGEADHCNGSPATSSTSSSPLATSSTSSNPFITVSYQDTKRCAVCWEDPDSLGGAVTLPCKCNVSYCQPCWDQALNAKFIATQRAQCPTCRSVIRVDFDSRRGRLTFRNQASARSGKPDPHMQYRLYEQARPFQVQLLRRHGMLAEEKGLPLKIIGNASEGGGLGPECVCGDRLECLSTRARIVSIVARSMQLDPEAAEADHRVTDYVNQSMRGNVTVPIICDICQETVSPHGYVWTCRAGTSKILHGLSYDVCQQCYERHVHYKSNGVGAADGTCDSRGSSCGSDSKGGRHISEL